MDVDNVGAQTHSGIVDDAVHQIFFGQGVDTCKAAGLTDAQEGIEANQASVLEAGDVLTQDFDQLQVLEVAGDGSLGQILNVTAVDTHVTGAVQVDAALGQGGDGDQGVAVDRQNALLTQLAEQLAECDHGVLIGVQVAVVAAVVAGVTLDGVSQDSLLGMSFQMGDDAVNVNTVDGAHQSGGLQLAVAMGALLVTGAGHVAHVAVAGSVDEDLSFGFHLAALAEQGNGLQFAVFNVGVDDLSVQQDLNTSLNAHIQCNDLEDFVVIDGDGVMHGAPVVGAASAQLGQAIDELLSDAADNLVAVLIQISQQGQADGHVAAEEAVSLDQQGLSALTGCCDCCGDTAGAAAHDNYVILQSFEFHKRSLLFC